MFRRIVVAAAFAVTLGIAFMGRPDTAQAHGGWYGPPGVYGGGYGGYPVVYGGGYGAAGMRLATPYPYAYTDLGYFTQPVFVTRGYYGGHHGRVHRGYRNPGVNVIIGF